VWTATGWRASSCPRQGGQGRVRPKAGWALFGAAGNDVGAVDRQLAVGQLVAQLLVFVDGQVEVLACCMYAMSSAFTCWPSWLISR